MSAHDIVNELRDRMTLALRKKSVKRIQEEDEEDGARQKDTILREKMKKRAQLFFTECVEKAGVAADNGESRVIVPVMKYGREENPKWCQYLVQYMRELLVNAKLNVWVEYDKEEPFGRDPRLIDKIYSVYLYISWA